MLLTYDRDLRDPIWWPQVRPVPMRVARGPLGISPPSMPDICGSQEGRGVNRCEYEVPVVKGFTLLDLDGQFEMHFIMLL